MQNWIHPFKAQRSGLPHTSFNGRFLLTQGRWNGYPVDSKVLIPAILHGDCRIPGYCIGACIGARLSAKREGVAVRRTERRSGHLCGVSSSQRTATKSKTRHVIPGYITLLFKVARFRLDALLDLIFICRAAPRLMSLALRSRPPPLCSGSRNQVRSSLPT